MVDWRKAQRYEVTLRSVMLSILAGAILLCAIPASARGDADVSILVQVILASDKGEGFDPPSLARVVELLGSPYDSYSSYRLVTQGRLVLPLQRAGIVTLPGNRVLTVTPLTAGKATAQLQAEIQGYILSKFSLRKGATQFIGGLSDPKGDLLIAITLE